MGTPKFDEMIRQNPELRALVEKGWKDRAHRT